MKTAKLFKNGQSQAVRLPKEFRMVGDEVYIEKQGEAIVLLPKNKSWFPLRRISKSSEINQEKIKNEGQYSNEIPLKHKYLHIS